VTAPPYAYSWQPSLFVPGDGYPDLSFDGMVRHHLNERTWVDYVPGWLHGHDRLFDQLLDAGDWLQRQRVMYDQIVDEPRLSAAGPAGLPAGPAAGRTPPEVERIRRTLAARYRVDFDSILMNLYRDGRDSVAWHRDTVRKRLENPVVATVSLGARRRFLLRPYGGGAIALRLVPGEGDLVVMGGACQHEWEHTVPKEGARTCLAGGARISVTLRHSRPAQPPASAR
jgi:alkylated DNA repair dioxygenase AlkB